jgi:hypothetical protein
MPCGPVEFLKECIATIFRVKEYARQASAALVACCLHIFWCWRWRQNVPSECVYLPSLQHDVPDYNLYSHCCENLKSCLLKLLPILEYMCSRWSHMEHGWLTCRIITAIIPGPPSWSTGNILALVFKRFQAWSQLSPLILKVIRNLSV